MTFYDYFNMIYLKMNVIVCSVLRRCDVMVSNSVSDAKTGKDDDDESVFNREWNKEENV